MKLNRIAVMLSLLFIVFTSCKDNEREAESIDVVETQDETFDQQLEDARGKDDVVNAIEGNPELSTFAAGLNAWDVQDTIRGTEKERIIFAPTNLAYSQTNQNDQGAMIEIDSEEIISYHIIETENDLAALKEEIRESNDTLEIQTVQGEPLKLSLEGNALVLTGATGVSARVTDSIQASDGMVYIIDKVLLPKDTSREVTITNEG